MRVSSRSRLGLVVSELALLSVAGCFHSPDLNNLSCTENKYCPDGYVCVGAQPASPGKCQRPGDAGPVDGVLVEDSASGTDARANPDGSAASVDQAGRDLAVSTDATQSPDSLNERDAASDVSMPIDSGHDIFADAPTSPPDSHAETAAPPPEVGPDFPPDLPSGPEVGPDLPLDLPYGPEVMPDVPRAVCEIGAINPANECQVCKLAATTASWSSVDNGTSCGSGPTCSGTTKSYGHWTCQGGTCVQPAATTCPSTGCDTNTGLCKDACGTADTAGPVQCGSTCCASSQFCLSNSNCAPKAGPGSACPNGNAQCTTNYCVDGTCCGSSSCGRGETCASGTCACAAKAARLCNSCADWDFEWGTSASPWLLDLSPDATSLGLTNGATSVAITSSLYNVGTGSHALVAQLDLDPGALNNTGEVALSLTCATSLAGYHFSAWLYLAGPALSQWNDGLVLDTWNGGTSAGPLPLFNGGVPTGQWVQANVTIPAADTAGVNRVGIRLVPSVVWTGQMYIDDVVLTAP
jgi:hypothetical protein